MRLSRFKKKHTAELNGGSVANSPAPETPVKEKKQAKKGGTKKRKLSEAEPEATVEDDNETLAVETPVKQEAKDEEVGSASGSRYETHTDGRQD